MTRRFGAVCLQLGERAGHAMTQQERRANLDYTCEMIDNAIDQYSLHSPLGLKLIVGPELAVYGWPSYDNREMHETYAIDIPGEETERLVEKAKEHDCYICPGSFEHAMITAMLFGFEHNLSDVLRRPSAEASPVLARNVERYLEANASQDIDMFTLARKTGHSLSSIYRTFRRHRDYTPLEFLRRIRMRIARQKLLQSQMDSSVTSIAIECGFSHLGRFSVEYKRLLGESQSETLVRSGK